MFLRRKVFDIEYVFIDKDLYCVRLLKLFYFNIVLINVRIRHFACVVIIKKKKRYNNVPK